MAPERTKNLEKQEDLACAHRLDLRVWMYLGRIRQWLRWGTEVGPRVSGED